MEAERVGVVMERWLRRYAEQVADPRHHGIPDQVGLLIPGRLASQPVDGGLDQSFLFPGDAPGNDRPLAGVAGLVGFYRCGPYFGGLLYVTGRQRVSPPLRIRDDLISFYC